MYLVHKVCTNTHEEFVVVLGARSIHEQWKYERNK